MTFVVSHVRTLRRLSLGARHEVCTREQEGQTNSIRGPRCLTDGGAVVQRLRMGTGKEADVKQHQQMKMGKGKGGGGGGGGGDVVVIGKM